MASKLTGPYKYTMIHRGFTLSVWRQADGTWSGKATGPYGAFVVDKADALFSSVAAERKLIGKIDAGYSIRGGSMSVYADVYPPERTPALGMMGNVDAMQVDELKALILQAAPVKGLDGARQAVVRYAESKLKACELRLAGRIPEALKIERKLDEAYRRLPTELKW